MQIFNSIYLNIFVLHIYYRNIGKHHNLFFNKKCVIELLQRRYNEINHMCSFFDIMIKKMLKSL